MKSISALNAIFSEGKRVFVRLKGYNSTMFYAKDGDIYSVNSFAGSGKRDDLNLEKLFNHFEYILGLGGSLEIIESR